MRYHDLTRLTRLAGLHCFIPSSLKLDVWLQTFLRTSIGTSNSLQAITLRVPPFFRGEWNAFDAILSTATCISQVYLSLMFSRCSPDSAKRLRDVFTTKEYFPNLVERGGFSIYIECGGVSEMVVSLPRRGMGYSGCT